MKLYIYIYIYIKQLKKKEKRQDTNVLFNITAFNYKNTITLVFNAFNNPLCMIKD
jgi:hypothetical protein